MIRHLHHADIDKVAWDRRLSASANALWYGHSATLDAASPGWDALIDDETGEQMPIPWRRKYGIRYAYQPFMLQQLGPFAPDPADSDPLRFLHAWPREFRFADINVRWTAHRPALPATTITERTNHELCLDRPIGEMRKGYGQNHRRSLRKAMGSMARSDGAVSTEEFIGFLEGSEQFARWGVRAPECEAMRRILYVADAEGVGFKKAVRYGDRLVAAGYFVKWHGRIIFLKGLSTAQGRELRAMHTLIDSVVEQYAGSGLFLDLAGGNDPQLARFYSGFGAAPVLDLRALMNRLPPLVRQLKK
jgi:hypothetical protein